MRSVLIIALIGLVVQLAPTGGHAGELRALATGEDSRGWNAVARLELGGKGFCTGALIAEDQILTAAHCLYDEATGAPLDPTGIEVQIGLRNGRAEAYRSVRRAVIHPDYAYTARPSPGRVRHDLALIELHHPVRNPAIAPYATAPHVGKGAEVAVVSYARGRENQPSLEETCAVTAQTEGVLVMSCQAEFGASGAPVFHVDGRHTEIVAVLSAKARNGTVPVSLGVRLDHALEDLQRSLADGGGYDAVRASSLKRLRADTSGRSGGAKFLRSLEAP